MKIDCSKMANKSDLMALILTFICIIGFCIIAFIASYNHFIAGFFSASLVWNWRRWLYMPLDKWLDKLWPEQTNS
ncbi:hypothetical protein [Shewanella algicola]|uniref:hypothetical protein n=1 Tax=Shewanella algicola TaxID=640633 RepID=UPI0024943E29|nr:hypothetical protein [Shewanella algicola]